MLGHSCRLLPATTERSHLPKRFACAAQSSATSVEEQAVSIVKQGPLSPRAWETRPEFLRRNSMACWRCPAIIYAYIYA